MSSKAGRLSRVEDSSDGKSRKRRQHSQESNSQSSRSRDSDISPKRRGFSDRDKRQKVRQRSTSSASSNLSRGSFSNARKPLKSNRSGQSSDYDRRRNFQNGDNTNYRRNRGDDRQFQQRNQGRFQQNRSFDNSRFNNRFDNRNGRNFGQRDNQFNQRGFGDRNRNNRNWSQNNDSRRFQNQRTQGTNWNRTNQGTYDRRQPDRYPSRGNTGRFKTGERYWKQTPSSDRVTQNRSPAKTIESGKTRESKVPRESRNFDDLGKVEKTPELSPEPKPVEEPRLELMQVDIEKPVLEKKKKKKRARSSSSSSSTSSSSSSSDSDSSDSDDSSEDSSSSSSSSDDEKKKKKRKKLAKKLKKKEKKRKKKKKKKLKKKLNKKVKISGVEEKKLSSKVDSEQDRLLGDISSEQTIRAKAMAPMTKKEWDKRQNTVRRIYDEESGRHRLIKGDGEVIEEIVSRDRHKQINKQATRSDGEYFQSQLRKK